MRTHVYAGANATPQPVMSADQDQTPGDPDDGGGSAQWRLELVAPPDFAPQQLAGTAVIELDDAQFPRYEVPFLVRLQ